MNTDLSIQGIGNTHTDTHTHTHYSKVFGGKNVDLRRVRPPGLVLGHFGFQHDGVCLQRANERVGFEADMVLVVRQQLHGVVRGVEVVLCTQHDQNVYHRFTVDTRFMVITKLLGLRRKPVSIAVFQYPYFLEYT